VRAVRINVRLSRQASALVVENERPSAMYGFIAIGAGVALALFLYPASFLLGLPQYWANVQGDTATNWIAYVAFANDDWRWPLFQTHLLNPPEGTNIFFSDALPLFALLGKAIFRITGNLLNYFGPWAFLSYSLQSFLGFLLLREVGLSRISSLGGAILFLSVPAFIFRIGHLPLMCHWVLLLALLFYLKVANDGNLRALVVGVVFTTTLILVNPYLLVMAAAIYIAGLGDGLMRKNILPRHALGALAFLLTSLAGLAFLFDFIDPTKPVPNVGGFGYYSMNVLSPIWPQLSVWPGRAKFVLDATGGQYEGYNYLGAGIILVIALAVFTAPTQIGRWLKRHLLLSLVVCAMALYALSSQVYFGDRIIGVLPYDKIPLLQLFSTIFRSSGRFFWPCAYLLLLISAIALSGRFHHGLVTFIFIVASAVQLFDIYPLFELVSERTLAPREFVDKQAWKAALVDHDELVVLPQFVCTKEGNRPYIWALGGLAAEGRIPQNSALTNRPGMNCIAETVAFSRNFRALATRPNPLVVVFKNDMNAAVVKRASANGGMTCRDGGFAYVCSSIPIDIPTENLGGKLGAPPKVRRGEIVQTLGNQEGLAFLTAGWSQPEEKFEWGVGPVSSLTFTTAEPICGMAILSLKIKPFSTASHIVDHADISVNGEASMPFYVSSRGENTINVPIAGNACTDFFDVTLEFNGLKSLKELGANEDPRLLNWSLISFSILK
jgi:hypothetical protein